MDTHGRIVDYLRISVTDRCNERCTYCMPEGYKGWEQKADHLTADEIIRVVRAATGLGFRKFRLTGGEPLVRRDLVEIVRAISVLPGVDVVGLSTNGTRLAPLAADLKSAGLRTVNISLDTLDPQLYRRITGGDVHAVIAGIDAAIAADFERIKLNCVLMRGINESSLWPLVQYAAERDLPLRLIELMPLTKADVFSSASFLSVENAMSVLAAHDELIPQPNARIGWGPAKYYRLTKTGALVGFIGAMTTEHFCETCNKMRLTADGKVRPCLGDGHELDLRETLRQSQSDDAIRAVLVEALRIKPLEHQFRTNYAPCRPMTAIGG